jgi:hypothetical protein
MLVGTLLLILAPLALMAVFVDDWSRDLTTNRAWTGETPGAVLPPLVVDGDAADVARAVAKFVANRPAWRHVDEKPLPDDSPLPAMLEGANLATHHLVRTTALMRWKDDLWVVVEDRGGGVRVHAESRSRVGKGDLGQNPRNLREILRGIEGNRQGAKSAEDRQDGN